MAWAYQSSGSVGVGVGTGVSAPYPATVNAGDHLLLWVNSDGSAMRYANVPSGFTQIWTSGQRAFWMRIADGAESGSVSITPSVTGDSTEFAGIVRFTGGPSTLAGYTAIEVNAPGHADITSTSIRYFALTGIETAAINGALVLGWGQRKVTGAAVTSTPSPFIVAQEYLKSAGTTFTVASIYSIQSTAANTSTADLTLDMASATSRNSSVILALAPGEPPVAAGTLPLEPLYYGAILLANKANITWFVTDGHGIPQVEDNVIASGITGTTNASGVFVPNGAPTLGEVGDLATLHLYWKENDVPVVDRSLIVKTTLVAA